MHTNIVKITSASSHQDCISIILYCFTYSRAHLGERPASLGGRTVLTIRRTFSNPPSENSIPLEAATSRGCVGSNHSAVLEEEPLASASSWAAVDYPESCHSRRALVGPWRPRLYPFGVFVDGGITKVFQMLRQRLH